MRLRKLEQEDAPYMLEWMHDTVVTENLLADFAAKKIEDCEKFIEQAQDTSENIHMAIVDDAGIYMGTVSLKHLLRESAEFAITIRSAAMSRGYSKYAMKEILNAGFNIGLKQIYWCVDLKNQRALRFYDKNGCERIDIRGNALIDIIREIGSYTEQQISEYVWYVEKA